MHLRRFNRCPLVRTQASADPTDRMPDNEVIAHISTFIFGGTDTTAALMARILQTLADTPAAQVRLRQEIAAAGELDHDTIMSLPFLDAVFKETLRMYAHLLTSQFDLH